MLIRILGVAGTLALLLVSGGIFIHNIGFIHDVLPGLPQTIREFLFGALAGILAVMAVTLFRRLFAGKKAH